MDVLKFWYLNFRRSVISCYYDTSQQYPTQGTIYHNGHRLDLAHVTHTVVVYCLPIHAQFTTKKTEFFYHLTGCLFEEFLAQCRILIEKRELYMKSWEKILKKKLLQPQKCITLHFYQLLSNLSPVLKLDLWAYRWLVPLQYLNSNSGGKNCSIFPSFVPLIFAQYQNQHLKNITLMSSVLHCTSVYYTVNQRITL